MTIKEFVIHALSWPPYDTGATATQLWHFAETTQRNIKLSSLSSVLKKMTDEGTIDRIKNFGPRKGYGYLIKG